jgi:hypothetical protein
MTCRTSQASALDRGRARSDKTPERSKSCSFRGWLRLLNQSFGVHHFFAGLGSNRCSCRIAKTVRPLDPLSLFASNCFSHIVGYTQRIADSHDNGPVQDFGWLFVVIEGE